MFTVSTQTYSLQLVRRRFAYLRWRCWRKSVISTTSYIQLIIPTKIRGQRVSYARWGISRYAYIAHKSNRRPGPKSMSYLSCRRLAIRAATKVRLGLDCSACRPCCRRLLQLHQSARLWTRLTSFILTAVPVRRFGQIAELKILYSAIRM